METFVKEFQAKHSAIKVKKLVSEGYLEDENGHEVEVEEIDYDITAIPNLDGLTLRLSDEADFKRLDKIIKSNPLLFKDFLGGKVGESVEVVLSNITRKPSFFLLNALNAKIIKASIGYKSQTLEIEIHFGSMHKTEIGFLADKMVGISGQRRVAIAKISGLTSQKISELEADARSVLRSILFDIECSYEIGLETANLENLKTPISSPRRSRPKVPQEPINLLYKPYTAELIEYFHTGERVDYLPFKFICYFHIIEYFMDKSAHSVISKKIKQIIMSPDFHIKSHEYISDAIKVFKSETERIMTDKIKIGRVFSEYLDRNAIHQFIESNELIDHFEKEHTLKCGKDLKINGLKFDSDQTFSDSLNRRIYSMRCSIVHSNPDFDETKAVPFTPSTQNMDFLRRELKLIKEVARMIIVNSIV